MVWKDVLRNIVISIHTRNNNNAFVFEKLHQVPVKMYDSSSEQ